MPSMPSWWERDPTGWQRRSRWPGRASASRCSRGAPTVGGGTRTEALTLPGFVHDVCSAVHPSLVSSPFFRSLDLPALGIRLRQPEVAFAHPLDGGRAAALYRDVDETASHLGGDAAHYRELVGPLVQWLDQIVPYVLSPMRSIPRDPLALARFARDGAPSVRRVARSFSTDSARALLAGTAAHSMEPLSAPLTAAFALLLTALGHGAGWPVVQGGSAAITSGLATELRHLGGTIHTDHSIGSLDELPPARAVLLDTSPRQFLQLAGGRLSRRAARPWARFKPGRGHLQGGLGPAAARCPGRPRPAGAPSPSTSGAASRRWPGPRRTCRRGATPIAPSCWWPSRAWSTPAGRPRATRPCGPTATCPTGRGGHDRADGEPDRAVRPGLPRPGAGADRAPGRPGGGATTRICSGATSTAGRRRCARRPFGPVVRWNPYRTPVEGRLSVLGLDAARAAACTVCAAWRRPTWCCGNDSGQSDAAACPEWRRSGGVLDRVDELVEEVPGGDLVADARLEVAFGHESATSRGGYARC